MRIGIREQLGLLVLFASLISLAVVSIAVWIENEQYVLNITSKGLSLTASLKASEIASDLLLFQTTCGTVVTRVLIQQALERFYAGNTSTSNWVKAIADTQAALSSGGSSTNLLQLKVFPRNNTGNIHGLVNTTTTTDIILPYTDSNGSAVLLGDDDIGYPPVLYPNITYITTNQTDPTDSSINLTLASVFPDYFLNSTSALLLGPLQINSTLALVSITLPIINNTSAIDTLGYMTIVATTTTLFGVTSSREGLDNTGVVLIVGPSQADNVFPANDPPSSRLGSFKGNGATLGEEPVQYVFPPQVIPGVSNRHNLYNGSFPLKRYPAAFSAFENQHNAINNASSNLSTKNEQNVSVSVGWARPPSNLVDWVVIIEQAHSEAWEPIVKLRNILLACVFGTAGVTILLAFPIAHISVRPIRELRDATGKSVQPPGYTPASSIHSEDEDEPVMSGDEELAGGHPHSNHAQSGKGFIFALRNIGRTRRKPRTERNEDARRRVFKIPGKVRDRKHLITDELTELTATFNEMSDELMMQYSRLEERVAERTRELEISKKAAEAANESKTLFIANISHELKTPLNGILGMCAVCMGEDDLPRIKRSLQVVYKSGDLLLNLLNDLLTFSKNQIGQQLSLEEKEFRLHDIKTQITTIFDKQVRDASINFAVLFLSTEESDRSEKPAPAVGPNGMGRLKDMSLWGDQHRILQVIINLVSNSLKFTPAGGKVEVRIKCVGEKERSNESSRVGSIGSKNSSYHISKNRSRGGSASNNSTSSRVPSSSVNKPGTALLINPMDPKATPHVTLNERPATPPPSNARTLIFEFEVEDTGPGIPDAMQQRVFEPFVQGDLGLSKKYGGTGLGLSICSQLAGLMGGSITLKSTVGVGTTFNMRIPLKFVKQRAASTTSSDFQKEDPSRPSSLVLSRTQSLNNTDSASANAAIGFDKDSQPRLVGLSQPFFASPAPSPAVGAGGRGSDEHTGIYTGGSNPSIHAVASALDRVGKTKEEGKIRVLVAEDNLVNQEVVLRMLKLEDIYDVTVAKDGQEAFDTVKAVMDEGKRFDLIFMDIQMPNLDGLQSTRLIRQMGYSAPIVALTAFADEINVKQCMDSGMDMFLSKPIRRPALKQVLKKFATIEEEGEGIEGGEPPVMMTKTSPRSPGSGSRDKKEKEKEGAGVTPALSKRKSLDASGGDEGNSIPGPGDRLLGEKEGS